MIIDTLSQSPKYYSVNSRFEAAFDFIKKVLDEDLPAGKYIMEEGALFASVQEYETKSEEKCRFEAHRKFIDIQYIVRGKEIMETLNSKFSKPSTEYKEDVQFFEKTDVFASAVISSDEYAIFFPSDIHRSGIFVTDPQPVKKIVVKVLVD